jgi:hypothetical protein
VYLHQATQAAEPKPYLVTVPGTDVQVDINPASSEIINILGLIGVGLLTYYILKDID